MFSLSGRSRSGSMVSFVLLATLTSLMWENTRVARVCKRGCVALPVIHSVSFSPLCEAVATAVKRTCWLSRHRCRTAGTHRQLLFYCREGVGSLSGAQLVKDEYDWDSCRRDRGC